MSQGRSFTAIIALCLIILSFIFIVIIYFNIKRNIPDQKVIKNTSNNILQKQSPTDTIGLTFAENKSWNADQLWWIIKFVSDGKFLNYIDQPVNIPVSTTQKVEMLLGIKGYYFDSQGKLQSLVFPIVVYMPNNKMYYLGGPVKNKEVQWNKTDILSEVKKLGLLDKSFVGESKGSVLESTVILDLASYNSHFHHVPNIQKDSYDYVDYISSEFQSMNKDKFNKFFSSGDSEIGYLISNSFGSSSIIVNFTFPE
jgi:hypothetical protein